MDAIWINLIKSKCHVPGDTKPCLVSMDNTIKIDTHGEYRIAIWAPKEGKKTYSMKLTPVESKESPEPKESVKDEPEKSAIKPIFGKKSLFK